MEHRKRQYLESLTRSVSFIDAHADALSAVRETPAYEQLTAAVSDASRHLATQTSSVVGDKAHAERRRQVERELRDRFMAPVSKFARAALRGTPDFAALIATGQRLGGPKLVDAARAMMTAASLVAPRFTEAKFPATFFAEFASRTDELAATLNDRVANRSARIEATSGIKLSIRAGRSAIAMLDPVVTRMLGDSEATVAWRRAKRVYGGSTGRTVTEASTTTATTTTSQPEVATAAHAA